MSSPTQPADEVAVRIAIAQVTLAVHRIHRDSGRCDACGRYGPCDEANNAANMLAASGLPVAETTLLNANGGRWAPARRLRDRARQGQNSPRSWVVAARLSTQGRP